MSSLSVCMMVQNAETTLEIALESLNSIYDELVIVDGGSTDSTCEIARRYGATPIHSPWTGNHSEQRNVYLKRVKTDWVFVLDSDEFVDRKTLEFLQHIKDNNISEIDNLWIPRKWLSPYSHQHYISNPPHYPDFQRRIFKYDEGLYYQGQIHEGLHGLKHPGQGLTELGLYHLDLFINSEESRQAKVRRYSQIDPRDGGRHVYLPDIRKIQLQEWDDREISPSVKQLIQTKKFKDLNGESQLKAIIPPEIKNDEFYNLIEQLTRDEDLDNILEIGSSSGAGSTAAFVKGMQLNPHSLNLFCLEVSQPRFQELQRRYEKNSSVKCYNLSSVAIENFPDQAELIRFYRNYHSNLNIYPLEQVLDWLRQDILYVKCSGVPAQGIKTIKQENSVDFFDLVLIDGSEFTGQAELREIYGAKYILLDDIQTFKNWHNYNLLKSDSHYKLVAENKKIRHGYAVFKRIQEISAEICVAIQEAENWPIHFFTIVLNGEPFIGYHIEIFQQLPFKWHWHIIEGVADLKHDTGWSINNGGQITHNIHNHGLSNDGTTEYLDEIQKHYPDRVTIYRQPNGMFWDGKREMVNEPLFNIYEECLLWQVDVDELWTVAQICRVRQMFMQHPEKTAAFYWCWYFVGENLLISSRNCYTQNPKQDWLRTWRFKPGMVWVAHEPPVLVEPLPNGQWQNVAAVNPFLHEDTEKQDLIFQHFAYVMPEQLQFKEQYYGYQNALSSWTALQNQTKFPVLLRQYFSWVLDDAMVDTSASCGVSPIAQRKPNSNVWQFIDVQESQLKNFKMKYSRPKVIIDGVFFQLFKAGVARVWRSLLEEWVESGFSFHIVFLDRAATTPEIPGIQYRLIPAYDQKNIGGDREMLQQICDEEGADVFISTWYTTPTSTPSVFIVYDMIPEVMGANLNSPIWREKHYAINYASAYAAISHNTAQDLVKFFPEISLDSVTVAHCGVSRTFSSALPAEISSFNIKYGITKPYFMLVSTGGGTKENITGYKNTILFFQAFSKLISRQGFDIVCTGSSSPSGLANEIRTYTAGSVVHLLELTDEELKLAYSGAVALVYPSKYEGFGLPILEAMACGCPVITCAKASIPEVADSAVLYVNPDDVDELANALCDVQKPDLRNRLIAAGLEQAKKFSWSAMAQQVGSVLIETTLLYLNLKEVNVIIFPDWSQPEESLGSELQKVLMAVMTHPKSSQIALLIDTTDISEEEANLAISAMVMNILMAEDLELTEEPAISAIGQLGEIQWQALLPRIDGRIVLANENKEAIASAKVDNLSLWQIETFCNELVLEKSTS